MADKAREWTDEQLEKLEKKISRTYKQAEKELTKKWKAYMKAGEERLSALEKEYAKAKKSGDATLIAQAKDKLQKAKENYTLRSQYYKDMVDSVTMDIAKVNQMALTYVNNELPRIYAANYEQIKDQLDDLSVSFSLVDKNTVMRMIDDGDIKLPKKKIDVPKDQRWNTKKINSSVLQGILQGESIGDISKRLLPIMDNNKVSAIRNARTLVTGAENRGRLDSYNSLKEQGAVLKKVWIATGDSRTRDWHLIMDGQEVDIDEDFVDGNGNKLEYPADPSSAPETVYNCRCSMRSHIIGFRKADGSISYIDYEPESGMHEQQIADEQARRMAESQKKSEKVVKTEQTPVEKSEFLTRLEGWGIDYKEVQNLPTKLTEDQIIEKLGGGDMTTGSCSSLAFSYAGNLCGYDVTDFRGGDSTKFFSRNGNIKEIASLPNVKSRIINNTNDFKAVHEIVKDMPQDKEFYLATGKHASIIRRIDDQFYYLELQSATENGYKPLSDAVLKRRFGCQKSHSVYGQKLETSTILIDAESLGKNAEFKNILGYMNTATDKQKKGAWGHVR